MKKLTTLALIGATALTATATAAAAQPYGRAYFAPVSPRQAQIERQIEIGAARGALTPSEARRLHIQADQLANLEIRYARNGLSYSERADLDRRYDRLVAQLRFERRDRDRAYGYGYGNGYGYDRRGW